jgi:MFS family permease
MLDEVRSLSTNSRLFLLSNGLFSFSSGVFFLVLNIYIVEGLQYSEYFLGILVSASSFAAAFSSMPAGIIGDRVGRKRCLSAGATIATLSMVILATTTAQEILVIANAVLGFSTMLSYVSFAPFMMENTSHTERMHLFSVNGAISTLGRTAGVLAGGKLPLFLGMAYADSLKATLLISVGFSLISVIPLLFLTEKSEKTYFSKQIMESTSLMWKFLLTQLLVGFGAGLIVPFFNIFFRIRMQVDIGTIGIIFSIASIATGIATFLAAPVATRWGKVRSVVLTQLGSLPFLLLLAYGPHLYVIIVAYVMREALMNMGGPISSAFMMEQLKENERATVNGIIMGGWNGSWALSNIMAGTLMSRKYV